MTDTILGTTLSGRYRLDARIGRGGMSSVYRAFDTVLEREVAIKLMHREIASDSDQLERFRREARAVAQLSHPHIVTVIDAGEWSGQEGYPGIEAGTPFIVFEYVGGETLKDLIRRDAPLDVPTALAYALEIARGLDCAHSHDIVHRDVKPQNILLSHEGGAKITDFGIARSLTEEGLTADGKVLGTTDYVSPEQALGQPVTGQSDVYSLGIVLYEMLTGSVPFKGDSPVAVAMMHVREEVPDVHLVRPEVSASTAAIVERAAARERDRRYPDMASLAHALEEALAIEATRSGQPTGEVTAVLRTLQSPARRLLPWRLRHPARWGASLALLGVAVALALVLAAGRAERGTGVPPDVHAWAGTHPIFLAQTAASSYNPFGTGPEHAREVSSTIDGDLNTVWSTEHYVGNQLDKPGLGVALDASPGVVARAIEIQTPTPGFSAAVYGSNGYSPGGEARSGSGATTSGAGEAHSADAGAGALASRGWTQLAAPRSIGRRSTVTFNGQSRTYRYYLVWITSLPPESASAEISEITLFR
ncbi:MAG: protein kinase domain-containing protein [Solirubrobacteraceae bacterium]